MAKKCYFCDYLQATSYFAKNNNKQADLQAKQPEERINKTYITFEQFERIKYP